MVHENCGSLQVPNILKEYNGLFRRKHQNSKCSIYTMYIVLVPGKSWIIFSCDIINFIFSLICYLFIYFNFGNWTYGCFTSEQDPLSFYFLRQGLTKMLRLTLNLWFSCNSLMISWDYSHAPLRPTYSLICWWTLKLFPYHGYFK